jgi:hypothetical protein
MCLVRGVAFMCVRLLHNLTLCLVDTTHHMTCHTRSVTKKWGVTRKRYFTHLMPFCGCTVRCFMVMAVFKCQRASCRYSSRCRDACLPNLCWVYPGRGSPGMLPASRIWDVSMASLQLEPCNFMCVRTLYLWSGCVTVGSWVGPTVAAVCLSGLLWGTRRCRWNSVSGVLVRCHDT